MPKAYLHSTLSPYQRVWRNSEDIWSWCRQNHHISEHQQREWMERIKEPDIEMFSIKCEDGKTWPFVGTCGLTSINYHHRTAEFSLFIAPEYQGRGYGKAGLIELLDYGFNRLNLQCIYGEVMQGNPALKMFESIGFKTAADMCRSRYFKHGKYIGSYQCDILAHEFNKLHKS